MSVELRKNSSHKHIKWVYLYLFTLHSWSTGPQHQHFYLCIHFNSFTSFAHFYICSRYIINFILFSFQALFISISICSKIFFGLNSFYFSRSFFFIFLTFEYSSDCEQQMGKKQQQQPTYILFIWNEFGCFVMFVFGCTDRNWLPFIFCDTFVSFVCLSMFSRFSSFSIRCIRSIWQKHFLEYWKLYTKQVYRYRYRYRAWEMKRS